MTQTVSVDNSARIVAFGEILWDMLPTGPKLGGAPVNFLYHARVIGANVQALTRIGDDQLGRDILARLDELQLPTEFVQISKTAPTGVVDVTLDAIGNPTYKIVENVAWDEIEVDDKIAEETLKFLSGSPASAFYFGSLALRTNGNREALERLILQLPSGVLRVCDLNIRPPFYSKEIVDFALRHSDVFKLNDVEAVELDALFADRTPSLLAALADADKGLGGAITTRKAEADAVLAQWAENWQNKFGLKTIILTCGAHGAYLFNEGRISYAPSIPVTVADAVGAGDSFAAVCVVGILTGESDDVIVKAASTRAAFVCSQSGGTPKIPAENANPFRS